MRWSGVLHDLKRVTKPGGWIELIEVGNRFHRAGPVTTQLVEWGTAIAATQGIDASQMVHLGSWFADLGLQRVHVEVKSLPVGSWGGRIGSLLAQDMLAVWPALRPTAQTLLGVSGNTFDAALAALEEEWDRLHTTYDLYCMCGQAA